MLPPPCGGGSLCLDHVSWTEIQRLNEIAGYAAEIFDLAIKLGELGPNDAERLGGIGFSHHVDVGARTTLPIADADNPAESHCTL